MSAQNRLIIEIPNKRERLLLYIQEKIIKIINDKCKHRGGPIHLCYIDNNNQKRCPWHDRKILKEENYNGICAVFYPKKEEIILIKGNIKTDVWPVKVITQ